MYELYATLPMPLPPSEMEEIYGVPDEAYDDVGSSRVVIIDICGNDDEDNIPY